MSNILEVSKLAGVSKATVSRVINGNGNVGEQNRERVLDAIATLNFRPSKTAQALATNKTNTVAVVFPESNRSKWGVLLPVIAKELQQHQMSLNLVCTSSDATSEYETIVQLQGQCDAVLLYSRVLSDKHIQKLHKELTIPLVVMNRASDTLTYPTVSIDQSQLTKMAMEHLVAKGHRHIACITGPTDNPSGQARMKGYIEALYKADLGFNPLLIATSDYQLNGGYQACMQLLELRVKFTAIICFNDLMAIGAQKALTEYGIVVPKQVSVVGIGNTDIGAHAVPELTSIDEPIKTMAKEATKLIINKCNKLHSDKSIILSGILIERRSTCSIKSRVVV
ncbi:LacI family DNA-binding transcriptional regulator [Vibrio breoganii]|uniref:LacI family DNA-binding transcriptional regulator n=1 Tax=Vibrio breoganii TaxID=553239 RepID=UPI0021C309E9|nr:LacI family DNA-binding transcriptional regulator [Vibrio breoganii]MDN3717684.1 LacI family DNA-binding transcriptional regulator [Vibrio breoganii]